MDEELITRITYVVLGFSCGFIFSCLWEISTMMIRHLAHRNGYHFHHSLFGLAAFMLIPKFWDDVNKGFFIAGFGAGVIIQHALKEGFVFVTKD